MNSRPASILLLVVVLMTALTPALAVAAENTSTTADTPGPYSIEELRQGGRVPTDAPDSVRLLGSEGAVAIREEPVKPLSEDWQYKPSGTTVQSNDLILYTVRFGDDIDTETARLKVVYWEPTTQTTTDGDGNERTKTVAGKQETQTIDVELRNGYNTQTLDLKPHFDDERRMTMWLVDENGEPYDGVRWQYTHHSVPSTAGIPNINSKGDLWAWTATFIGGPAIIGLLGGVVTARRALKRAGRGPDLGIGAWAVLLIAGLFAVSAFVYFQTAVILSEMPWLIGVGIALVGIIGYLEVGGPETHTIQFSQDELEEAHSPAGDDDETFVDAVFKRITQKAAVRREDGTLGLPKPGIRPFLARYYAEPAKLSDLDIQTQVDVDGPDVDQEVVIDPDSDEVLVHEPARLVFNPEPFHAAQDCDAEVPSLTDRINWSWWAVGAFCVAVGYYAGGAIGLSTTGIIVGLVGLAIYSHEARDGYAAVEPAPVHYRGARATIENKQVEYKDAKTLRETEDQLHKERATTAQEARQIDGRRSKSASQRLVESEVGMSLEGARSRSAAGEVADTTRDDEALDTKTNGEVPGEPAPEEDEDDEEVAGA